MRRDKSAAIENMEAIERTGKNITNRIRMPPNCGKSAESY
jgi:hypothetical protein